MISDVLAAMSNNFAVLFPTYYQQLGFGNSAGAPKVHWYYGPKYLSQQNAPNQVVAVVGDEPFVGSEVAQASLVGPVNGTPVTPQPRELSRLWTRISFYCWGANATLPAWTPTTSFATGAPVLPTTGNQNGLFFEAVSPGGTTGATEPTWPSTVGGSVLDGTVTWNAIGSVDDYRIHDTDMTDLVRMVVAATAHYTAVGSYRPIRSTWYDSTDQLVMDGFVAKVTFEFLIPVIDVAPTLQQVGSIAQTGVVNIP